MREKGAPIQLFLDWNKVFRKMCLFAIPGLLLAAVMVGITHSWSIVPLMLAVFLVMGIFVSFLLKISAKNAEVFTIEDEFLQYKGRGYTDKIYFSQMQNFYISKQILGFKTLYLVPKGSSEKPIGLDLFSSISEKGQSLLIELLQQKGLTYLSDIPQR